MPKTIEQGSNKFTTWLGNLTAFPTERIKPLFSICLGFKQTVMAQPISEQPQFDIGWGYPRFTPQTYWPIGRIAFGRNESMGMFYNGAFYFRMMFPFWIGIQIRWAGSDMTKTEFAQFGIGWKLNGRLAALARAQTDCSAAAGVTGVNAGQATGWFYGAK